jgi:hypothetical protein
MQALFGNSFAEHDPTLAPLPTIKLAATANSRAIHRGFPTRRKQ